jgi:hypothetical protein
MSASPIPKIVDLMPRDPSPWPPYSPRFLIAFALSAIPYQWSGRALSEESMPVSQVVDALRAGGYKIVPMEREDYEPRKR